MTEKLLALGVIHHPTVIEYYVIVFLSFRIFIKLLHCLLIIAMLNLVISHFENSVDADQLISISQLIGSGSTLFSIHVDKRIPASYLGTNLEGV